MYIEEIPMLCRGYMTQSPTRQKTVYIVLCILHLDMTTNKKKLFHFYKFICSFSSALNTWKRTRYGNLY